MASVPGQVSKWIREFLSCMGMMQAGPVSFCIPVETAAHEDSAGNNFRAILQRTVLEEL